MSEIPDTKQVEEYLLNLQDRICEGIAGIDGVEQFAEDNEHRSHDQRD